MMYVKDSDLIRCSNCGTLRPVDALKWHGVDEGYRCIEVGFCKNAKLELEKRKEATR